MVEYDTVTDTEEARRTGRSRNALVEELAEEAAKTRLFPGIAFRGTPRRAWVIGSGLDVWEIVDLARSYAGAEQQLRELHPLLRERHLTLAKVYAEILESSDTEAARVLLQAGSGRTLALVYGLLPVAASEIVSYTVYRWECALRASVVMGFVGAGGLGQLMDQSMKMMNGAEAATILVVFLLLVLMADAVSAALRKGVA